MLKKEAKWSKKNICAVKHRKNIYYQECSSQKRYSEGQILVLIWSGECLEPVLNVKNYK